jgi:hypothetical protein
MNAIILTFHAIRRGEHFALNDHIAFDATLNALCVLRIPIRPLSQLVAALDNPLRRLMLPSRFVVLTSDDGEAGEVRQMPATDGSVSPSFSTLQQHYVSLQKQCGGVPHLTRFVIASRAARLQICPDNALAEDWWRDVALSPLGAVENHSWDHCHADVTEIAQRDQLKGTFKGVDNYVDANRQIRLAAESIDKIIQPKKTNLFAYPYGDTNAYLIEEYFPRYRHEHKMKAAFTTEPLPVTKNANRWALPRYVCGHHWQSADEFRQLLKDAMII